MEQENSRTNRVEEVQILPDTEPAAPAGGERKEKDRPAKKKNKKARWIIALAAVALVALAAVLLLRMRIGGSGDALRDEWNTPSYLRDKTMNILVCGADINQDRENNEEATSTDVIIVANIDLESNRATLFQIPRDAYVGEDLVVTGKINALYNYGYKDDPNGPQGITALAQTIYDQFKLPVDNYVLISMEGFRKAVDVLGGIEVTIDERLDLDAMVLEPGTHLLDGETAELFVRARKNYAQADIKRLDVQRYFLAGLMNRLMNTSTTELISLATEIYPYLETDLTVQEILQLAIEAKSFTGDSITTIRAPGEPVSRYGIYGLDVFTLHRKALADMLNEYMRPYAEPVPETELGIIEIQNTTDILDGSVDSLDQYGA